ncbi:MAG: hypothetical protein ACKO5Q_23755, partial [Microcystaceae cyanobacterium]
QPFSDIWEEELQTAPVVEPEPLPDLAQLTAIKADFLETLSEPEYEPMPRSWPQESPYSDWEKPRRYRDDW